jgi:hypothetical protein
MIEPPPSLQTMVIAYGGYDNVPEDAWERFEKARADWQSRVSFGELKDVDAAAAALVASRLGGTDLLVREADIPAFVLHIAQEFTRALGEIESGGKREQS